MEALILSCGTGGGHNAAAAAIREELRRRGHHVTMLNPYRLHSSRLSRRVDKAYIVVAQHALRLFGVIYSIGNLYRYLPWKSPVYFINRRMAETMRSYFQEHPVDVVIMTHLFPGEILTGMRDQGMAVPKTILVATDYTCIPFMEECVCDAYVIPSEKLVGEFEARGIPAGRIYPLGIPVSRRFLAVTDREEAKKALGLNADKRYILVAGGSIGAGKLKKALRILHKAIKNTDLRMIVICGSNEALRKTLERRYRKQADVIGFTDQMPLYLKACDLYFTKPGGLSTTEAAVAQGPLVLLPPIPGCESRNRMFFTRAGMAVSAELSLHGMRKTISWFESDRNREKMFQNQAAGIPGDAAERVCDLAEGMK